MRSAKSYSNLKTPKKTSKTSSGSDQKTPVTSTTNKDISLNLTAAYGLNVIKGKTIDFKVLVRCTNEKFNVNKFPVTLQIRDLKGLLEFVCGIPYNLQRLSYLDDGELIDNKEVQYYDVIDGALIIMDIWTIYVGLVKACTFGNLEDTLKQGVSTKVDWVSPTSEYMYTRDRKKYISDRSGIALFIAAHRGNINLIKGLVSHGANTNFTSSFGRTPIMVAVVTNKLDIIDYLLENNVDVDIIDSNGDTALTIAKKFNNKLGQHRLTQFKWRKRVEAEMKTKKNSNKSDVEDVFNETRYAHQIFDSHKKTWLKGNFMQMYMMQLVPPQEFSGSSISAPKSVGKEVLKQHRLSRSNTELKFTNDQDESNLEGGPLQSGLTFDKWLAQKLKAKKLEKQQKKKSEALSSSMAENKEESTKESVTINDTDTNIWMKDYTKMTKSDIFDQSSVANRKSNSFFSAKLSDHSMSSLNNSAHKKNLEVCNIYKGMPYDEWSKIRDEFLKNHNML